MEEPRSKRDLLQALPAGNISELLGTAATAAAAASLTLAILWKRYRQNAVMHDVRFRLVVFHAHIF
jgi:hypothetical protein